MARDLLIRSSPELLLTMKAHPQSRLVLRIGMLRELADSVREALDDIDAEARLLLSFLNHDAQLSDRFELLDSIIKDTTSLRDYVDVVARIRGDIFALARAQGTSFSESARLTGLSQTTVLSLVRRAEA